MRRKISMLVAMTLSIGMLSGINTKVNAEVKQDVVSNIKANTYVGDDGIMVDSFELTVADGERLQGLTSEDFNIVGNSNSSMSVCDYEDDGIELVVADNKLIIDVNDFRYDGTQTIKVRPNEEGENTNLLFRLEYIDKVKRDFEVICSKDSDLSFGYSDITEKATKTLDEFVSGEYTSEENGKSLRYDIYMPTNDEKVPLVIWLHGGGEVLSSSQEGANIAANRGATTWIESGYETAVLSFQYPENYKYAIYDDDEESKEQLALMEEYFDLQYEFIQNLIKEGKVDSSRIYVVGASSGGGAAVRFLMQYPDLFAAAIPIATKDTIAYAESTYSPTFKPEPSIEGQVELYKEKLKGLEDIPIWFVHAIDDPICNPVVSSLSYQALQELGSTKVKMSMYSTEEMGGLFGIDETGLNPHASWINALNDDDMISWLFAQQKESTVESSILNITVNAIVKDLGETVESLEVVVEDDVDLTRIKPEDFIIKNAVIDHFGNIGEINVKDISVNGNTMILTVDPFLTIKSNGSMGEELKVTCKSNDGLSFTYSDIIKIISPVADKFETKEYNGLTYKLYSPDSDEALPVVIWMHGRGDNGLQLRSARNATMFAETESQEENPCYVFAPQSDESATAIKWTDNELENTVAVLEQLIEEGKVDPNRVYLTGHSMGGQGAWNLLRKAPDMFAAAIIMSPRIIAEQAELDDLAALKDLPIWFFHATNDPINLVSGSKDRYNKLLDVGNIKIKYTELSDEEMIEFGAGDNTHATNIVMANTEGVTEWLFDQTKAVNDDSDDNIEDDSNSGTNNNGSNSNNNVSNGGNQNNSNNSNINRLPNTGNATAAISVLFSIIATASGAVIVRKKK